MKPTPAQARESKDRARALIQANKAAEARSLLLSVVSDDPRDAETWHFLGIANALLGNASEAENNFREALAQGSASAHTPYNLANILLERNEIGGAIAFFQRALEKNPAFADALANLALAFAKQNEFGKAIEAGRRAIELAPDSFGAYTNLGLAYFKSGQPDKAIECYQQAILVRPDDAEAHVRHGAALAELGHHSEALDELDSALKLDPQSASAHFHMAGSLLAQARLDEAAAAYRTALKLEPDHTDAATGLLFILNYLPGTTQENIWAEHKAWGKRTCIDIPTTHPPEIDRDTQRRLRVGYVSPDFRKHSVAYFMGPVLEKHDGAAVEVYCYSNARRPDSTTEWLKTLAPHWREITNLSDKAAAQLVRDDRIDILIDLAGHTGNPRLGLFCLKPAPIQVSYLGYPNTTGLSQIDYRLTDSLADPPGQDAYYTETLFRLPEGFLCYGPWGDAPDVAQPPATRNGYTTFGSFNTLAKANAEVIHLWATILRQVPHSRLILKSAAFAEQAVRQRIAYEFRSLGVDASRLELSGHVEKSADHLALYNRIDVALDTFPYNGTTTTCEALWMGVPVVTLAGNRHAARVGVSLVTRVGLPELIAETPDDYVRIATELADNVERLAELRRGLRERMAASPLCDAESFTRQLERAYRDMWQTWCAQQAGK